MTPNIVERAERAIADFESAGSFLRGPFFEAVVCRALREALLDSQSPWLTRSDAAARWRCSEAEIDRAAKVGILTKQMRGGTPLFAKEQGDEAIKDGLWRKAE